MQPGTARRRAALATALVVAATLAPAVSRPASAASRTAVATPVVAPRALSAQARISVLLPGRVAAAKALGRYRTGLVSDVATGATVWQTGSRLPMRGASTTKLATAVTALRLLGTGTRFPTRVVSGRWPGEVVLVGGGDPLLTSAQLAALARSTALALLPAVAPVPPAPAPTTSPTPTASPTPTPSPSPTDTATPSPSPTDSTAPSATPTDTAAPSPTATPSPSPTVPVPTAPVPVRVSVRVDDSLYPAPSPATGWLADYQPSVVAPVRPLVRDLRHVADSARDAAEYFTVRLDAELKALTAGRTDVAVTARYTGRLVAPAGAQELARFTGNTSGAALSRMLLVSDNDVAEMLFRDDALAAGRPATWAGAQATETAQLRRLGIDLTGWRLYDGSGVSRADQVTARGLVQLLRLAQQASHPELAPLLRMLPVAGVSGTLAARDGRFTTRPTRCAAGRVFAKTGTLHDAIALAGYAVGSDRRLRAFAVLVRAVDRRYTALQVRRAVEVVPATATGCY